MKDLVNPIRSAFGWREVEILSKEVEKLEPGQIYFEVGVERGKSLFTAYFSAKPGVIVVGVDVEDWEERKEIFGVLTDQEIIFIHGESSVVSKIWDTPIDLLFIDGAHHFEGIKRDTESWWPKVKKGGVALFHDYEGMNAPDISKYLDERFGDKIEVLPGTMVKVIKK